MSLGTLEKKWIHSRKKKPDLKDLMVLEHILGAYLNELSVFTLLLHGKVMT